MSDTFSTMRAFTTSEMQSRIDSQISEVVPRREKSEQELSTDLAITDSENLAEGMKVIELQLSKYIQSYFTKWKSSIESHKNYLKSKFFIRILRLYNYDIKRAYLLQWKNNCASNVVNVEKAEYIDQVHSNTRMKADQKSKQFSYSSIINQKYMIGLSRLCTITNEIDKKLSKSTLRKWLNRVKSLRAKQYG